MTNPKNPDEMRLRGRLGALNHARAELVALADGFRDRVAELNANPYLTREERQLRIEYERDQAKGEIDAKVKAARGAATALREATAGLLDRHKPSSQAQATVRNLLNQEVGIGSILKRARELGDVELVVAARSELKMLPRPKGVGVGKAWVESEELEHEMDLALAELVPGTERDVLPDAVKHSRDPAVEPAAKFAVRTLSGDEGVAASRLELAYAMNGNGGTSEAGDGSSD